MTLMQRIYADFSDSSFLSVKIRLIRVIRVLSRNADMVESSVSD